MANELSNLKPPAGSTKKRTRVGRGEGSGKGKTAGRGTKGQKSRSGRGQKGQKARAAAKTFPGFECGQMPLQRRLPKRGFHNAFAKEYTTLNVSDLEGRVEKGAVVDAAALKESGVISKISKDGIKVLGDGELKTALTVRAAKFTRSASEKIEAAGGTAEIA